MVLSDLEFDGISAVKILDRERLLDLLSSEKQAFRRVDLDESKLAADSSDESKKGTVGCW